MHTVGVPTDSSFAHAAERISRVCRFAEDSVSLRLALLEELRAVVGYDAFVWLLTDPETQVGCAPLADVPCPPAELPRLIRLKYLTPVNRWTGMSFAVATLANATGGHRDRSLVWREMMSRYGIGDVASMVFRDRFGCWGFLDLWRSGGLAFSEPEVEFLRDVVPVITESLRRAQAATFHMRTKQALRTDPIVLLLSPELEVKAQTAETDAYLRLLVPPDGQRPPVPAGAFNVAGQLLALEAGVDGNPALARVHLAEGTWLTLRAARMGGDSPVEQDIAVTIEQISAPERLALFGRTSGLSGREQELLRHLAAGFDTRTIAEEMVISPHTIQDHFKSIFIKTGTHTRRALLAAATGD